MNAKSYGFLQEIHCTWVALVLEHYYLLQKHEFKWKIPGFWRIFPRNWNFQPAMLPDYCLTNLIMNYGRYHLERLKSPRGDQVAFYQWENWNGLKSGLSVNLQKTVAKRTRSDRLKRVRKELFHRNTIGKLLASCHCGQTCLSPGPQISWTCPECQFEGPFTSPTGSLNPSVNLIKIRNVYPQRYTPPKNFENLDLVVNF